MPPSDSHWNFGLENLNGLYKIILPEQCKMEILTGRKLLFPMTNSETEKLVVSPFTWIVPYKQHSND
jgi:hypothetical protein